MPTAHHESIQNRLLSSLPPSEWARLRPKLTRVDMPLGAMLAEPGDSFDNVHFPLAGMISLVRPMLDGHMVEVGVVGREGYDGITAVLGGDLHNLAKMVQIDGSALRIPIAALRLELDRCPVLRVKMLDFVQALLIQISQTAACNGRHNIQERLARWLLMASDRADADTMLVSHEFLSMMLGVRRSGVSVALGVFTKAGLLRHRHGQIEILDRNGLEAAACECYGDVREEYKRLLH